MSDKAVASQISKGHETGQESALPSETGTWSGVPKGWCAKFPSCNADNDDRGCDQRQETGKNLNTNDDKGGEGHRRRVCTAFTYCVHCKELSAYEFVPLVKRPNSERKKTADSDEDGKDTVDSVETHTQSADARM